MDMHNQIKTSRGISPVSVGDNTAQVSQIVDTANFRSTEFVILIGSVADADATFAVLFEEGNASDMSDNGTVAAGDLIGTAAGAGFQFDSDNTVRKIGYKGSKRYCRVTITPSANTSAAVIAGVWLQGHPSSMPISSQS